MHKIEFSQKDLDLIVKVVSPDCKNKKGLKRFIQEDESFRESMTGDEKLFNHLMNRTGILEEISPNLFFEILLRQTRKEMQKAKYTIERTASQSIPIFDSQEALDVFDNDDVFYYLIDMLASFVRIEKETPEDINIDSLMQLAEKTEAAKRFPTYKRIGDACLLTVGIFPEHLMQDYHYLFFKIKPPMLGEERKEMGDYEFLGQKFYSLACKEAKGRFFYLREALQILSENFYLVKKPLNFISEHYLAVRK